MDGSSMPPLDAGDLPLPVLHGERVRVRGSAEVEERSAVP